MIGLCNACKLGPDYTAEMLAIVNAVSAAECKISIRCFMIQRKNSSVKIVVKPFAVNQIAGFNRFPSNRKRWNLVVGQIFIFLVIFVITLTVRVMQRDVKVQFRVKNMRKMQLIMILYKVVNLIVLIPDLPVFIGIFAGAVVGTVGFKQIRRYAVPGVVSIFVS